MKLGSVTQVFSALAITFSLALFAIAAKEDAKKETKPALKKITQGGYVETIDPSVDYKNKLKRINPMEPAESMKRFKLIDGFQLQQVATEPLIADSVAISFDENGRMFVAEMIPYSQNNSHEQGSPDGRVSVLEDTDGDGVYDKSTIYADQLIWPTGVLAYDGGVFVASAPDLWYFKDTDGDNRADIREKVISGFGTQSPNSLPNSLRFDFDNRIHVMTSTSGGPLVSYRWEKYSGKKMTPFQSRGRDFSFNPNTGEIRPESGGQQHGMTFDDWGQKYESWNSSPLEAVMYEDRYIARNPFYAAPKAIVRSWQSGDTVYPISPPEPWRAVRMAMRQGGSFSGPIEHGGKLNGYFTATCGVMVYKGDAWPKEYRGQVFACEGASNVVHREEVRPKGLVPYSYRIDEKCDFIASEEIWYRPVQIHNGPDGNLYVVDMYREIFELASAVPVSAKKYLDLSCGNDRGRVYRVVHESNPTPRKTPQLGDYKSVDLVPLLAHDNFWHRNTAARLLYQRQDPSAVDALQKLATTSPAPLGRMQAMYTLAGYKKPETNALTEEIVLTLLDDKHPRVRQHAVRAGEKILADSPAIQKKLCSMIDDPDLYVRYQLSFTLGDIPGDTASDALAKLAKRDGGDTWFQVGLLSSCNQRAGQMFTNLIGDAKYRKTVAGTQFLGKLAEQIGLQKQADQVDTLLAKIDTLPEEEQDLIRLLVSQLCKGCQQAGVMIGQRLAESENAQEIFESMVKSANETATNEEAKLNDRVTAVSRLSLATFDDVADTLAESIESHQPKELQVGALKTLNRFPNEDVAEIIIEAWGGFSPEVRKEAAEVLFARPERISALLDAFEKKTITPAQVDAARIEFLMKHPNKEIQARAKDLLGSAKLARRDDVVQSYHEVLAMKGHMDAGRKVFRRECTICHKLENQGYDLGLPLSAVKDRGSEFIMTATLDPNRDALPQYLNYVLVKDDGLSVTGMISSETATSLTLTRAEGEQDTVLRANIDELQNTGLSIMPEGLEKQIKKQEMADLLEYLMNVK